MRFSKAICGYKDYRGVKKNLVHDLNSKTPNLFRVYKEDILHI